MFDLIGMDEESKDDAGDTPIEEGTESNVDDLEETESNNTGETEPESNVFDG